MRFHRSTTFFSSLTAKPAPGIDYVWDRLLDIELTAKRKGKQGGGSAHLGEVEVEGYYQGGTRGRGSFRGRGRGRAGGRIGGRVSEVAHDNCSRCGHEDHWARDCPPKEE